MDWCMKATWWLLLLVVVVVVSTTTPVAARHRSGKSRGRTHKDVPTKLPIGRSKNHTKPIVPKHNSISKTSQGSTIYTKLPRRIILTHPTPPTFSKQNTTSKNFPKIQQLRINSTKSSDTKKNSTSLLNRSHGVTKHHTMIKNLTTQQPVFPANPPSTKKNSTGLPKGSRGDLLQLPNGKTGPSGHTSPANISKNLVHPPTYPGYPGSQSHHTGSGPQWSPPGYVPINSMLPGLNVSHSGGGGLGYSKNFFRPSNPTILKSKIPNYHYPSSIPSRGNSRCECYVKGKTAACTSKLKDKRIPSCVNSSVTALFIKSKEVDELPIDAFSKVPHLKYINITDTKLISLPRDFFRDTKGLKHLVVQKNPKLKSLHSDIFRDAYMLEDVILDRNSISVLERDVFTHLKNVKRLNLGYNKIRSLSKGIFRDNRELQELQLTGNPLHISSDTARDLLRNNAKLRVLLMRNCKLQDLPMGLLKNASNLEWLDVSNNNISKFPAEFIHDCTKLDYLELSQNKLTVLSKDMLHQHGGSLAILRLEANPWNCDCTILPLASWATLRNDSVPVQPKCSSPHSTKNETLQRWFHSKNATNCGGAHSSLRTDLNRVMSVARAIAKEGPGSFTNLLNVSDKEVGFTATNYFSHALAARTDNDVEIVVWHWARFLEKVLDRRHLRYTESMAAMGVNSSSLDWPAPTLNVKMDPLQTTPTKTPTGTGLQWQLRPKGFDPLVNFTYIMKNISENLTKAVDDGIEEELKILFGVIKGTNTTTPSATGATVTALSSAGDIITTGRNTAVATSYGNLAPSSQNGTDSTTMPADQVPLITSIYSPSMLVTLIPNMLPVVPISASTPLPVKGSNMLPVNALLNTTSPTNVTSSTNQNITNSTYPLPGFNVTTTSARSIPAPLKKMNVMEVVAGLRSELREVLSILVQSIDRANWDEAYQKYVEEKEKRAPTSPKSPKPHKKPPKPHKKNSKSNKKISAKGKAGNTADSYVLISPRLTVLVAFLTLLRHTLP